MGKVIKNPDEVFYKNLKRRIKQNNGYCPNKPRHVPENKCPCQAFREGKSCDCGQYIEQPEDVTVC